MKITTDRSAFTKKIEFCCSSIFDAIIVDNSITWRLSGINEIIGICLNTRTNTENLQFCPFCGNKIIIIEEK